ncbi:hypothetical protein, partial [Vibrio cholerae]|uniref:hypothetical protein n=1 Tax=Vibrio cholerae TaxID=666 RepID=UPI00301B8D71
IEGTVSQQINAKGTVTTYEYSEPSVERYLEQVKEGKLGNSDTKVNVSVALIVRQTNVEYEADNPLLLAMKALMLIFEVKPHLRHHLTKHHR